VNLPAALKQYEGQLANKVQMVSAPDDKDSGVYNIELGDSPGKWIHH
jgi:hypothetical protein